MTTNSKPLGDTSESSDTYAESNSSSSSISNDCTTDTATDGSQQGTNSPPTRRRSRRLVRRETGDSITLVRVPRIQREHGEQQGEEDQEESQSAQQDQEAPASPPTRRGRRRNQDAPECRHVMRRDTGDATTLVRIPRTKVATDNNDNGTIITTTPATTAPANQPDVAPRAVRRGRRRENSGEENSSGRPPLARNDTSDSLTLAQSRGNVTAH